MKRPRDTTAPGAGSVSLQGRDAVAEERHFARRIRHMSGTRRRDESGQALVEFALVLPLVILIVAVAFNGWDGMQTTIRLTSAARAGALQAAAILAQDPADPTNEQQPAWDAAVNAVNAEENTSVYQNLNSSQPDYVNLVIQTQNVSSGTTTVAIGTVTITVSPSSVTLVPYVGHISVTTHATARYS
jgi:Flp pilus assembly protein TadG